MKKSIFKIFKIVCAVFLVAFCLIFLNMIVSILRYGNNSLDDYFAEWNAEEDPNVLILNNREPSIEINDVNVDYETLLDDYINGTFTYEFYTVYNDVLYGVVKRSQLNESYYRIIDIVSINLKNKELSVLYTDNYVPVDEATGDLVYGVCDYYYSDRCITIHDGEKNVSYNIETNELTSHSPTEFSYPKQNYEFELIETEEVLNSGFKIKTEFEERIITIRDMADRNEYMKSLTELKPYWTILGKVEPLYRFFGSGSFRIVNNDIYIVGYVADRDGEANYVVFRYDYAADSFTFIYHAFYTDYCIIRIIPIEK